MANNMGTTASAAKLRAGPGTDTAVRAFLLPKTPVEVIGEQGDWLHVKVAGKEGYIGRSLILLDSQGVADGFLKDKTEPAAPPAATAPPPAASAPAGVPLADVPLEAPASERLPVNPKAPLLERLAADIWNRYGGLLSVLSAELKIDPGV